MVYSGAPGYEEVSIPKGQVIGGVAIGETSKDKSSPRQLGQIMREGLS